MRTTVDLDEEVIHAVKELARARRQTFGQVLSELARRGFTAPPEGSIQAPLIARDSPTEDVLSEYGFEPLPHRGGLVTNEVIDGIRDQEGL